MNKIVLVVLSILALSSVACSPSVSAPLTPASAPSAQKPSTPECNCEGKGEDCIVEGSAKVGSGVWDLTKRGVSWTYDAAKKQMNDEGNQKKAGEVWDSVKEGAGSLYDSAKDAIQ